MNSNKKSSWIVYIIGFIVLSVMIVGFITVQKGAGGTTCPVGQRSYDGGATCIPKCIGDQEYVPSQGICLSCDPLSPSCNTCPDNDRDYCNGRGKCINKGVGSVCQCNAPYFGTNCKKVCTSDGECKNGGKCKLDGTCDCTGTGYGGDDCGTVNCTSNDQCKNGGICQSDGICKCKLNFAPPNCSSCQNGYVQSDDKKSCERPGIKYRDFIFTMSGCKSTDYLIKTHPSGTLSPCGHKSIYSEQGVEQKNASHLKFISVSQGDNYNGSIKYGDTVFIQNEDDSYLAYCSKLNMQQKWVVQYQDIKYKWTITSSDQTLIGKNIQLNDIDSFQFMLVSAQGDTLGYQAYIQDIASYENVPTKYDFIGDLNGCILTGMQYKL